MTDAAGSDAAAPRSEAERRHAELGVTLAWGLVVCALAAWAFSGLLEEVLDGATMVRWDMAVSAWAYAHTTPAGLRTFAAISQLGQGVAWLAIAVVAVWLLRRGLRLLLWFWLAGNAGGALIDAVLKRVVQRDRPLHAMGHLRFHSYSFPSGHTMTATVCYLLLAYVLCDVHDWTGVRRIGAYAAAALVALLVAMSRVYLGVHFPSDVAGGLAAGVAWVAACAVALRVVRHRAIVGRTPAPRTST